MLPTMTATTVAPRQMASPTGSAATQASSHPADITASARAFEAMFVAEMLAHAGLGGQAGAFGGGEGETAFNSFLTRAYADSIAASGRFGLAEAIVRGLSAEVTSPEAPDHD